jgi:hypothetical protein
MTLQMKNVADFGRSFGGPFEVEVREPTRNTEQNKAFHSAVSDIARQVTWHGQKLPAGVWKRLLCAAWMREAGDKPYLVPALDGVGVDVIYERTSKLSVKAMSSLIEWTMAFGSEHGCRFTTKEEW